jgi:hypothetical protein
LKIYSSVTSSAPSTNLTSALVLLEQWCTTWQLHVNITKTFVLHLGYNNPHYTYTFQNTSLNVSESAKDLGVEIDVNLNFDLHISKIVSKAQARVGTLFRGFTTRNASILRKAYVTYVRPILDYASNVWNPYLIKHINAVEKVQRRFTKRIPSLRHHTYEERLALLDLETLECRRLVSDLVLYYKIINNLTLWHSDDIFTFASSAYPTRLAELRPSQRLVEPQSRTNLFHNDFYIRCIPYWNALPQHVVDSSSVKVFKSRLRNIDLSPHLKYQF